MATKVILKDSSGTQLLPLTTADQVNTSDNKTVQSKITSLEENNVKTNTENTFTAKQIFEGEVEIKGTLRITGTLII